MNKMFQEDLLIGDLLSRRLRSCLILQRVLDERLNELVDGRHGVLDFVLPELEEGPGSQEPRAFAGRLLGTQERLGEPVGRVLGEPGSLSRCGRSGRIRDRGGERVDIAPEQEFGSGVDGESSSQILLSAVRLAYRVGTRSCVGTTMN